MLWRMGWHLRFWRRLRIAPGVTLNLSKSGASVSAGPRGAKVTVGRLGIRRTIGIPGTGVYATSQSPLARRSEWRALVRAHPNPTQDMN